MFGITTDLRLALRSLSAGKALTTIAVITLALGIGISTAVFSILDSVILRPVPYADADRLVDLMNFETKSQVSHPGFSPALLAEWRRQTDLFDRVEGYDVTSSILDTASGAEMVTGATVTPGLLSMLGVQAARGRIFGDGDGGGGTDDRLVISHAFWSDTFGRDPDVIGRTLTLDQRTHTVVGVMPATFRFPNEAVSFWRAFNPEAPPPGAKPQRLGAFARVRADVPIAVATERVSARGNALNRATGGPADRSAVLFPAGARLDDRMKLSLKILGGAVVFLLLIVCANLANLSLARALTRARDVAVRSSLGATRATVMRETLVEHALVGVAGVAAGIAVAYGVLELTQEFLPRGFRLSNMNAIDIDLRTLGFAAAAGLVTVALFGLPPAWLASRFGAMNVLGFQSRSATGSRGARRVRHALVVVEVALAIVLLVGATLMARSLVKLQHVDRGFDAAGLIAIRVGLPRTGYADVYARDAFSTALMDRFRKLPGVTASTVGSVPPDANMVSFGKLERDDRPGELSAELIVPVYQVWSNYFDSVGITLREGRAFTDAEAADSVIVSESMARNLFEGRSALGRRVRFEGDAWRTIVGVAAEVRQNSMDDESGSFEMYYPLKRPVGLQQPQTFGSGAIVSYRTFVVRASDVPASMIAMRQAVHDVDPRVVVWRVDAVERLFADAIARPRLVLLAMVVFSALGVFLAAAGLYGALSYAVTQRRREIGIRLALGAQPATVGRLVLWNGLSLTLSGLLIGLGLALGLTRVMRTLLYEVDPTDPLSVTLVSLFLLTIGALAAWLPARRAMRVDPGSLLRDQ